MNIEDWSEREIDDYRQNCQWLTQDMGQIKRGTWLSGFIVALCTREGVTDYTKAVLFNYIISWHRCDFDRPLLFDKFFCIKRKKMVKDLGIPKNTLDRKLKQLEDEGWFRCEWNQGENRGLTIVLNLNKLLECMEFYTQDGSPDVWSPETTEFRFSESSLNFQISHTL
jgi:hypothetical protein